MQGYAAPSTQALRGWQRRAMVKYLTAAPRDFLAVATPGSGKTTFALRIAGELLADGTVERITIVVPTEHLKIQWAKAAARIGISLDPKFSNSNAPELRRVPRRRRHLRPGGQPPRPAPGAHREPQDAGRLRRDPPRRRRQELGRGGPRGVRRRDPPAGADRHAVPQRRQPDPVRHLRARTRRLRALDAPTTSTATPTRSPTAWCGRWCSWPTRASRAGATAPARNTRPGSASRSTPSRPPAAWRTALNPAGEWMPAVHRRGRQATAAEAPARARRRRHDHRLRPDRGQGLRRAAAPRSPARRRRSCCPTTPAPRIASRRSRRAPAAGWSRCAWCPRASTCPRLAVGVYATSASTPLFFAQAIGRYVRSRRPGETASIFLPSVPNLLQLASEMEAQRNHVLGKPHREAKDEWDEEYEEKAEVRTRRDGQRLRNARAPTPNWIR